MKFRLTVLLAASLSLTAPSFPAPESRFVIRTSSGSGYIDDTGKIIIQPHYGAADDFSQDLAAVFRNGFYGFIDRSGAVVIPFKFSRAKAFSENLAAVENESGWGFVDRTGQFRIPPRPNDVGFFSEGRAWIQNTWCRSTSGVAMNACPAGPYGFIDTKGTLVIPVLYNCTHFRSGLSACGKDGRFGYIDPRGTMQIPFRYDLALSFADGLAIVERDHLYGFIDARGNEIIPPQFLDARDFVNGIAPVRTANQSRGYWSFINKKGEILFETRATAAQAFSGGLAAVQVDGKWGYLDPRGIFQIPPGFDFAHPFRDGLAMVVIHDAHRMYLDAYINTKGEILYKSDLKRSRP